MDTLNLEENKLVYKKPKLSMKEKISPRYADPKHAPTGRNEESSRTTS